MQTQKKPVYRHHCPHCGARWTGRKEHIVSCTFCHQRLDDPEKVVGKQAALQYIEQVLLKQGHTPTRARKEASGVLKQLHQKRR
jgi:hypothetical protein